MHNNVRSSARNWYVALAFILIIIALVLAGCASVNREESGTTTATERDVADAAQTALRRGNIPGRA